MHSSILVRIRRQELEINRCLRSVHLRQDNVRLRYVSIFIGKAVFTVTFTRQKNKPLTQSRPPHFSVHHTLSQVVCTQLRVLTQEARSLEYSSSEWQNKCTSKCKKDCIVVLHQNHTIVLKHLINIGRCRAQQHNPTGQCMVLQDRIASLSGFSLLEMVSSNTHTRSSRASSKIQLTASMMT